MKERFLALILSTFAVLSDAQPFSPAAVPQDESDFDRCVYNDEHFHIQDFKADGPPLTAILKMIQAHVCRSTLMGLAVTVAHDPLVDRDFAPVYYTQTDGQIMYYNAIQDVLVAHKFLALPDADRAKVDPLMSAFNLKDARAGDYAGGPRIPACRHRSVMGSSGRTVRD